MNSCLEFFKTISISNFLITIIFWHDEVVDSQEFIYKDVYFFTIGDPQNYIFQVLNSGQEKTF